MHGGGKEWEAILKKGGEGHKSRNTDKITRKEETENKRESRKAKQKKK